MGAGGIALLTLQGIVFVLWAFLTFRTLFLLRRRAVARGAGPFPGPLVFLAEARLWLRDPADRTDRQRLAGLTLALIALSLAFSLTRP